MNMYDCDFRLYLCSNCYHRCLWHELSQQEHRCKRCRLSYRGCIICNRQFEPRHMKDIYCKRCEFHLVKKVSNTPPPELDLELEHEVKDSPDSPEDRGNCAMSQRWKKIMAANGCYRD
ncbi:protein FAM76B [Drosophila nasuta]|uniref:Protein FAM76B n=1 Tax=Drosophila albomicans TaxID=7291 RepID=A0A6P8WYT7_DROAB|nr:protein FAM76B [Drosophila albomicans]XP_060656975.1 protein FAM76B [Drosophila nasuta]